eukprot:scaffold570_cov95-Isochrysis_galbana.AAC.4
MPAPTSQAAGAEPTGSACTVMELAVASGASSAHRSATGPSADAPAAGDASPAERAGASGVVATYPAPSLSATPAGSGCQRVLIALLPPAACALPPPGAGDEAPRPRHRAGLSNGGDGAAGQPAGVDAPGVDPIAPEAGVGGVAFERARKSPLPLHFRSSMGPSAGEGRLGGVGRQAVVPAVRTTITGRTQVPHQPNRGEAAGCRRVAADVVDGRSELVAEHLQRVCESRLHLLQRGEPLLVPREHGRAQAGQLHHRVPVSPRWCGRELLALRLGRGRRCGCAAERSKRCRGCGGRTDACQAAQPPEA